MEKINICIDVGGSYVKYAIINSKNIIELYDYEETNRKNILKQIQTIITKLIKLKNINKIGISIPGAVNIKEGTIIHAINLNLYNFNLVQYLKEKFDYDIFIISDRDAGLIGCLKSENYKYTKNVLAISWGTGVALSIFQNNKLYKSTNMYAPEFGHTYISDNKEYKCFCGKTGCLNAISGSQAVKNRINKYLNKDGDNIEKCLKIVKNKQDVEIEKIFANSIYYISKAISNIYNIFDPECVFIWGGMSEVAKYYYNEINEIVNESVHKSLNKKTNILISNYGRKSALYGINAIANNEINILED